MNPGCEFVKFLFVGGHRGPGGFGLGVGGAHVLLAGWLHFYGVKRDNLILGWESLAHC